MIWIVIGLGLAAVAFGVLLLTWQHFLNKRR